MKNVSVWFNSVGFDCCYFEGKFESYGKECLEKLIEKCSLLNGVEDVEEILNEFIIEFEEEGWKMYSWDGIGIFVVDEGCDVKECKKKYDEMVFEEYNMK